MGPNRGVEVAPATLSHIGMRVGSWLADWTGVVVVVMAATVEGVDSVDGGKVEVRPGAAGGEAAEVGDVSP